MTFVLGLQSRKELLHVLPQIVNCVELAITKTQTDFRVNQGLRTLAEQKHAVASGNSRTMKSRHLMQPDGYAHAVDLVAIVNGKVSWQFKYYANIAFAMDMAATELKIANHIRWGCAWDRVLSDFGGSASAYLLEARAYSKRHAGSDLLDAPHFEWVV
jgi:peptidoglycan L-alanyl-D-glutamate endopeptidase CwlK